MLVLRLPLRLAARATPSHAPVATPIVAASLSATRSYRTKADDSISPEKSTTPKKKAASVPKKLSKEAAAKATYKLLSPEEKTIISVQAREAKKKDQIKLLKAQALTPPNYRQLNIWSVYIKENTKTVGGPVSESSKILAQRFKDISSTEREHLNHLANQHNAKSLREFQEWLNRHTPAQIFEANAARARLRRLLVDSKLKYSAIKDERLVKRPLSSYLQYHTERLASGDFRGVSTPVASKDIAREFKALSASERKTYEDRAAKDVERYNREHLEVYGFERPVSTNPHKEHLADLDAGMAASP
ncbi:unnamed protein product [Aureobasidium mustum]|uniref:HMG box domain-containing protein n=1 Tax=Aureobasidium mustum TaxID=2773714 RepID=A0A9N8JZB0_9PEZI|nr:unnamed protein product [Aureobasidium mustum]